MNKKSIVQGRHILKVLAMVTLLLSTLVIGPPALADSLAAPIKIGTSTALDRPTLGMPRWKAYMLETDPNQFWAGYTNGSKTRTQISYTTDGGTTWSTDAIQIEPAGYLNMHCSVFGLNGNLYATWPGRNSITFRQFSTPIHGNIDGGPLVPIAGTTTSHRSNLMVQNTGRIWLFTRLSFASTSENVRYHYSDDNGGTWSDGTAFATNFNSIRIGSMPYVGGNPALVVLYLNDARGFEYYLWNGTSFEAQPDHSIYHVNMRQTREFTHNVVRDTTFHIIFGVGTTLHHVWKNFNNGSGSWNHQIIDNSPTTTDNEWTPISTVRGDDLYIFYCKKSSSDAATSKVYYKVWSQLSQTWTDPVLMSTDAAILANHDPNTCFRVPENSPYVPVTWSSGSGPFDIYFAKVIVDPDTTTVIDCPEIAISCLPDTIDIEICYPTTLSIPLAIANQTQIEVSGATWSDNILTFTADTSGIYSYQVTALNSCSSATCQLVARVLVWPSLDLYIADGDVTSSDPGALIGETVTLSAVIRSDAESVPVSDIAVRFFDGDPNSGGALIGIDQIILTLDGGQDDTARVQYMVVDPVSRDLYVVADPDEVISECSENNNMGILSIAGAAGNALIQGTVAVGATPLQGAIVDLLDSEGNEYLSDITDISGHYQFKAIPSGNYIVDMNPPLGFAPTSPVSVPIILAGENVLVDFELSDIASGSITSYYWWKNQIQAIRNGVPLYLGLTRGDINGYCATIYDHFYDRTDEYAIDIADVTYTGSPAVPLTFDDIARTWLDVVDESNAAKTRKHLLACLLNVASTRLSQRAIVSYDGATACQAINYLSGYYLSGGTDDWTLWYNLNRINSRVMIAAGVIPLSTANVLFKPGENEQIGSLPSAFALLQNYPNPFNPKTEIRFVLPGTATAVLEVFNIQGQKVTTLVDKVLQAGEHRVTWNAANVASGVYLYRLTAGKFTKTKRMVLLK